MVYVANTVVLIELIIPFNSPESLKNAQSRKQSKQLHQQLVSDQDSTGKPLWSPLKSGLLDTLCLHATSPWL